MKFGGTLIAVRNMERSKRFYCDLMGMTVTEDFGANVTLSGSLFLQTMESWKDFIHKEQSSIILGNNATELYFEEDDMDSFLERLEATHTIRYVHPVKEHSWGQRAVRFYDPDYHIIEVGENMKAVVRRFLAGGMTVEQAAVRMDVSENYIRRCMEP